MDQEKDETAEHIEERRRRDRERKRKSRANQAAENSAWIVGLIIGTKGIYFDGQFVRFNGSETITTLDGKEKKIQDIAFSELKVWFRLTADGRAVDIEQAEHYHIPDGPPPNPFPQALKDLAVKRYNEFLISLGKKPIETDDGSV